MSTSLGSTFSDGDLISVEGEDAKASLFVFKNSLFTLLRASQYPNLESSRSTLSFFLPRGGGGGEGERAAFDAKKTPPRRRPRRSPRTALASSL